MNARVVAAGLIAVAVGCGSTEPEPPVEPVEFAELCGQTEPVRLLRYPEWRKVEFAWHIGVFGDRRLLSLRYADTDPATWVLWSVGKCGEAPRQLLSGACCRTFPGQDWPFVCDDGELRVVDPSGERAPKLVATLPDSCRYRSTSIGLFAIRPPIEEDSFSGDLIAYRWPSDIWSDELESEVVVEGVKMTAPTQTTWDILQGSHDELFFVTVDDELVGMDVADGSLEVIASGVRWFELGWVADPEQGDPPRYVVWQRMELTNDDPELPEGEILVLDRSTNVLSSLGYGMLTSAHLRATNWTSSGLLQLPIRIGDELVLRLFQLPDLSYVDVAPTIEPHYMLDDDRTMIVRFGEDGPFGTLDVQTGESAAFADYFADSGHSTWHAERAYALLPDAGADNVYANSELWVVRGSGPPELFADRASIMHQLMSDGRLLTGINLDEDTIGDLIVVDNFEERLIAKGVLTSPISVGPDVGEDMITYSILEGERAGLWLARLPPRD